MDIDPAGIKGLGDVDIGAHILVGSLCQVGRELRNIDGGERMQAYDNAGVFRLGPQSCTAFRGEGVKRFRTRIQPEIDIVEPMGGGPVQTVYDGKLGANINPDTVDQRHGFSSTVGGYHAAARGSVVRLSSSKLNTLLGPDSLG